jgi:hypothetical protein
MSITALKNRIRTEFLSNDKISAREAQKIMDELKSNGISATEKAGLQEIRAEFLDKFSASGLKNFDRLFTKHVGEPPAGHTPTGGATVLDARLGRNLDNVPTRFRLSEVQDTRVRDVLMNLDVNIDGVVDTKDRDRMGFSDDQFRMFIFSALIMGKKVDTDLEVPTDLSGKTVVFTGLADTDEARAWAESMGATVERKISENVDFLFVGSRRASGKDERAHILNTLGQADIAIVPEGRFFLAAHAAGVTGPGPTPIDPNDFVAIRDAYIKEFITEWMEEGYEDAIASEPHREQELRDEWASDLQYLSWEIEPNDYWIDMVYDRYASGDPYLDKLGRPVPEDQVEVFDAAWGSDLAGIILSVPLIMDRRTGEVLDQGDIRD